MKRLVYLSVYGDLYVDMLRLLVKSLVISKTDMSRFDILIFTLEDQVVAIENIFVGVGVNVRVHCMSFMYLDGFPERLGSRQKVINFILDAAQMRLRLWEWGGIDEYDKILYLDTDILIENNLDEVFDLELENKLYALQEEEIGLNFGGEFFWGGQFFDFEEVDENTLGFSSGVLLFNNCAEVRMIFEKTLKHIETYMNSTEQIPETLEQGFLVYQAIMSDAYNGDKLTECVVKNPTESGNQVISHFAGGPGNADGDKIDKMSVYLNRVSRRIRTSDEPSRMRFFTWSNEATDERLNRLMQSATMHGISVEPIGVGRELDEGGDYNGKNLWLYERVCELDDDELVVCTDAFDVIYLTDAREIEEKFLAMNAPIVFSAEYWYDHHFSEYKTHYRRLGKDRHFKYLNSGCMIGYAKNIKEMFEVIFEYDYEDKEDDVTCDQGFIGKYFVENPGKIKLDYECRIFWTDVVFQYFRNMNKLRRKYIINSGLDRLRNEVYQSGRLYNQITNTNPCIFHGPWPGVGSQTLDELWKLINEEHIDEKSI